MDLPEVVTIAEACKVAVDDQARALAAAWGLLSYQGAGEGSGAADDEAVAVGGPTGDTNGGGSGAGGTGGGGAGGGKSRAEWAPLWEAMGMLSVPAVSVGAVAAGKTGRSFCSVVLVFFFVGFRHQSS